MKRFSAALAAIIASALFAAGCTSSPSSAPSPSKNTSIDVEEAAWQSIITDLESQGFTVVAGGPFAHELPSKDSPVSAAFVEVKSNCGTDVLVATNEGSAWRVTHEDGTPVTAEEMKDQRCGG